MLSGLEQIVAAFLVGLLGGVHCVGMCGGIVGTLTLGLPVGVRSSAPRLFPYQFTYNLGRIAGYGVAGALMGGIGQAAIAVLPLQRALYLLAAIFMILLGLFLAGWWPGWRGSKGWGRGCGGGSSPWGAGSCRFAPWARPWGSASSGPGSPADWFIAF
jgi:sulfite exporter TauE/SafE